LALYSIMLVLLDLSVVNRIKTSLGFLKF